MDGKLPDGELPLLDSFSKAVCQHPCRINRSMRQENKELIPSQTPGNIHGTQAALQLREARERRHRADRTRPGVHEHERAAGRMAHWPVQALRADARDADAVADGGLRRLLELDVDRQTDVVAGMVKGNVLGMSSGIAAIVCAIERPS